MPGALGLPVRVRHDAEGQGTLRRTMALKRPSPHGGILLRLTGWLAGLLLVLGTAAFVLGYRLLLRMYQPAIEEVSKDLQEQAGFFCEQQALLARANVARAFAAVRKAFR